VNASPAGLEGDKTMRLPAFERKWHEIELAGLAGQLPSQAAPAGPEFYSEFYSALQSGRGKEDLDWTRRKVTLGSLVASQLFEPWERRHGRRPLVLALCTGQGVAEGVWLERGYSVTLHECQLTSLLGLRARFPDTPTLISDVRQIAITSKFDLIVMLASEYFLNDVELVQLMREISGGLTPDGVFILHSVSVLSARQGLKEILKRVLGRYRTAPHVFWGWWRTPYEFHRCARAAGLTLRSAYTLVTSDEGYRSMQCRPAISRRWTTLSNTEILMVFGLDR
jgi:SAM-dependent methyltransferase